MLFLHCYLRVPTTSHCPIKQITTTNYNKVKYGSCQKSFNHHACFITSLVIATAMKSRFLFFNLVHMLNAAVVRVLILHGGMYHSSYWSHWVNQKDISCCSRSRKWLKIQQNSWYENHVAAINSYKNSPTY